MYDLPFPKICIVGNIAGGKTRLARRLSILHGLPLTHVDTIQFLPGMIVRPLNESRMEIQQVENQSTWIIDGYGPLDLIEKRFQAADRVIFIDFKLSRHLWWLTKRQFLNIFSPRAEIAKGTNEVTLHHSIKLYKTLLGMHKKMRPELLKIFARDNLKNKMIYVNDLKKWNELFREGIN